MVERIYSQIYEENPMTYPETQNRHRVRRADIIHFFLKNPMWLKVHDFKPADFIFAVNEIEASDCVHNVSLSEFKCLLEKPRDSVTPGDVNGFFVDNPCYENNDKTGYYFLLENDTVGVLEGYWNTFEKYVGKNGDELVRIDKFIETLQECEQLSVVLNKFAVYMLPLNRLFTLSHIFMDFLYDLRSNDNSLYSTSNKKVGMTFGANQRATATLRAQTRPLANGINVADNQYMTFNEFLAKIKSYSIKSNLSYMDYLQSEQQQFNDDSMETDFQLIEIVYLIVQDLTNEDGFACTEEIISAIRDHRDLLDY
jgi:hypothetical protein